MCVSYAECAHIASPPAHNSQGCERAHYRRPPCASERSGIYAPHYELPSSSRFPFTRPNRCALLLLNYVCDTIRSCDLLFLSVMGIGFGKDCSFYFASDLWGFEETMQILINGYEMNVNYWNHLNAYHTLPNMGNNFQIPFPVRLLGYWTTFGTV